MRFDLSAIPLGAKISHVELDTTTRAGYAQDGDPAHWALFLPNDSWSENQVTWNTRPLDGLSAVGDPNLPGGGGDVRTSNLALGAADVWRAAAAQIRIPRAPGQDVPEHGRRLPQDCRAGGSRLHHHVSAERSGDGKLSLELWTPNCPVCQVGSNLAYWARYYTRDALDPAVRPRLVVTVESPPPVVANVQLTGPGSTEAGAGTVALANVPPSVLLRPQSTAQAAPVNETPVNETPVNELPVNELPVNETPVNELGFDDLAGTVPALGSITLASIPLLRTGGWIAALTGTPLAGVPLQNVTLRDYYALPTSVNPETRTLDPIPPIQLGELDLSRSPLGSLPASALVLANVKLSDMRSLDTWCQAFGTAYCSSPTSLSNETVMAAALQGAPVNETPVNETPVNEIPVNEVPVNETPVNEVPVNELPVNETPVNELPVNETPVNEIPVNELRLENTPVNETPVNELPVNEIMARNATIANSPVNEIPVNELTTPTAVIACATQQTPPQGSVNCLTATLGQAYTAGAIGPGVTLGDLRRAAGSSPNVFDTITLGDLNYWGDAAHNDEITLRELIDSLEDGSITLGDYFLLILRSPTAQQGLAWERLDLFASGLPAFATDGPTLPYAASFDVQPGPGNATGPAEVDVDVTLPSGFLYDPKSSKLAQSAAGCGEASQIGDPSEIVLDDGRAQADVDGRHRRRQRIRHLLHRAARPDPRPTGGVSRRHAVQR